MAKPPPAKGPPAKGPSATTAKAEREARLAAALRANLHRRKAQARGREPDEAEAAAPPAAPIAPHRPRG